jgi:hypothetical protein
MDRGWLSGALAFSIAWQCFKHFFSLGNSFVFQVFMASCDKQVKCWDLASNQAIQVDAVGVTFQVKLLCIRTELFLRT